MKNGVGAVQNIVLFGGTSEIGQAVLRKIVQPGIAHLVLVSRDIDTAETMSDDFTEKFEDISIHHVRYDAQSSATMCPIVDDICAEIGDLDIVVIAQGLLQENRDYYSDPMALVPVANVNFTSTMVLMYAVAAKMKKQGYGKIVLLSSVAGERVRKGNPVYGATKAGIDGFALALDHELAGSGASVLVVRPGFVTTKMTQGMKKAPFSTDAESVANVVSRGITADKKVVWAPGILQWMFLVLKNLPLAIWRRLPL